MKLATIVTVELQIAIEATPEVPLIGVVQEGLELPIPKGDDVDGLNVVDVLTTTVSLALLLDEEDEVEVPELDIDVEVAVAVPFPLNPKKVPNKVACGVGTQFEDAGAACGDGTTTPNEVSACWKVDSPGQLYMIFSIQGRRRIYWN